jgi:hypothetical protein
MGGFVIRTVDHESTQVDTIAKRYEGFVPVINADFWMFCDLDVLFHRAEPEGRIMKRDAGGGDIDNRMKVLFDALCIPQSNAAAKAGRRNRSEPNVRVAFGRFPNNFGSHHGR